jgi:hypothetical protein
MLQSRVCEVIRAMPTLEIVERAVWWLEVAGYLVLFLHLWREGLLRTYRFFSAFVLFQVASSAVLTLSLLYGKQLLGAYFGLHSPWAVYARVWFVTKAVQWVLSVLVVLELYGLVLQKHKGIASLGRWAIFAGLGIALTIACLTLPADFSNASEHFPILRYIIVIDRGIASSLVIFLLLITGFFASYPVPLSRNVVIYSIGYAVYFLGITMTQLFRNVNGVGVNNITNIVNSGMSIACQMVWILFLNRRGETVKVTLGQHWRPEQEQQLIEQLAAINSTLLRAARK